MDRKYQNKLSFQLIFENSHIKKMRNIINDYLTGYKQFYYHQ